MVQLIYASAATTPFTASTLDALLVKARKRNLFYQVSGLLLYHSGSFLQVLEGREESVERIYASIGRDGRHTDQKVLLRKSTDVREFAEWSMGFADTSTLSSDLPGMVDYHRQLPALTLGSSDAQRYLRFFYQGLCRQNGRPALATARLGR